MIKKSFYVVGLLFVASVAAIKWRRGDYDELEEYEEEEFWEDEEQESSILSRKIWISISIILLLLLLHANRQVDALRHERSVYRYQAFELEQQLQESQFFLSSLETQQFLLIARIQMLESILTPGKPEIPSEVLWHFCSGPCHGYTEQYGQLFVMHLYRCDSDITLPLTFDDRQLYYSFAGYNNPPTPGMPRDSKVELQDVCAVWIWLERPPEPGSKI